MEKLYTKILLSTVVYLGTVVNVVSSQKHQGRSVVDNPIVAVVYDRSKEIAVRKDGTREYNIAYNRIKRLFPNGLYEVCDRSGVVIKKGAWLQQLDQDPATQPHRYS